MPAPTAPPPVVLASSSRYRRALLSRLLPDFRAESPDVDESRRAGEDGAALTCRLARDKAGHVARQYPGAIVIGSDQAAEVEGRILGKPGSRDRAVEQLVACAGRTLRLLTAVCVVEGGSGRRLEYLDVTRLAFRRLERPALERYVERDEPFDCAGSFRFESLGIALFERVETTDPTAIEGLPLVWLSGALGQLGVAIP